MLNGSEWSLDLIHGLEIAVNKYLPFIHLKILLKFQTNLKNKIILRIHFFLPLCPGHCLH